MPKSKIIIVDDELEMRSLLQEYLGTNRGFDVICFSSAISALESLSTESDNVDIILSDIKMPQMSGLEFTEKLQLLKPEIPIILMTAFGSIETAIEAMQKGAFHYIVKPLKLTEVSVNIDRALEHRNLRRDNSTLRQEIKRSWSFGNIIGKSAGMKSVYDLVNRVSSATTNVLITGESGTGKEMIARAIHESGPRAQKPFIAINCSAIPETLLESELFGHAKGAFTGAIQKKLGLFEEAEGGTLFLDEIGDMNVSLQSKLLRVLQERKVRAVGENTTRDFDVRIIAATHKDLRTAMKEGRFRDDLYYRLSVIPIVIPPLRHRKEDIPILAEHFLRKYSATNNLKITGFTRSAIHKLTHLKWEGNVRELENVIERAVVLCTKNLIDEYDIPNPERESPEDFFANSTNELPTVTQLEKRYIQLILEKTGGRKDKAAQILGMNRRTLYRKEREYGFISENSPEDASSFEDGS